MFIVYLFVSSAHCWGHSVQRGYRLELQWQSAVRRWGPGTEVVQSCCSATAASAAATWSETEDTHGICPLRQAASRSRQGNRSLEIWMLKDVKKKNSECGCFSWTWSNHLFSIQMTSLPLTRTATWINRRNLWKRTVGSRFPTLTLSPVKKTQKRFWPHTWVMEKHRRSLSVVKAGRVSSWWLLCAYMDTRWRHVTSLTTHTRVSSMCL